MKKILLITIFAVGISFLHHSFGTETNESQKVEPGSAESNDEDVGFNLEKNYSPPVPNKRSYSFWHFQITTTDQDDYPPSFLRYSHRAFSYSTLPPLYGNKIIIKK
ncbi:MAG: hypothetical protein WBD99_04240 [Thermodesulfobacteriota bacterium]